MNKKLQILMAARSLIENPESWAHNPTTNGWGNCKHCVLTAVTKASFKAQSGDYEPLEALQRAVGVGGSGALIDWNDAPERTHAEILAAFDKAIDAELVEVAV